MDMSRLLLILGVGLLVIHGLIHLMGTAVYMRIAEIQGLRYKTTILGGRLDLGDAGTALFGALWILPAAGFLATALALSFGWERWRTLLLLATVVSLLLTSLDWSNAFMGATVDMTILVLLYIASRFPVWIR